jgi:hypothetical protein
MSAGTATIDICVSASGKTNNYKRVTASMSHSSHKENVLAFTNGQIFAFCTFLSKLV